MHTPAGWWEPRFAPVAEAFGAALAAGERGALCLMHEGRVVLEIHGGEAGPGQPWAPDTLACCFSVTKGVLGLLAQVMIARGMLDIDAPVGSLWPEFRRPALRIGEIVTHRAGLPAVSGPAAAGDLYDWGRMVALLAASEPVCPGDPPVYHNMTWGHLVGEVLCRAAGVRPLSRLLAEMVTAPLGSDFHLGLGPAEMARAASLTQEDPSGLFRALVEDPGGIFARSMAFFDPAEDFNTAGWRAAEIGSGSGHATARAIATIFGQFVWRDALIPAERQRAARRETGANPADPVLGIPIRYGEGVELSTPPALDFGPNPEAVGHWGAGGAQGSADPATGLSFGYVTGHMAARMGTSGRCRSYVARAMACMEAA